MIKTKEYYALLENYQKVADALKATQYKKCTGTLFSLLENYSEIINGSRVSPETCYACAEGVILQSAGVIDSCIYISAGTSHFTADIEISYVSLENGVAEKAYNHKELYFVPKIRLDDLMGDRYLYAVGMMAVRREDFAIRQDEVDIWRINDKTQASLHDIGRMIEVSWEKQWSEHLASRPLTT